ncbi:hypothetical protein MMC21_001760 [Puttea exsequens]|nr:hypothetical protein [Puttea exsequens]
MIARNVLEPPHWSTTSLVDYLEDVVESQQSQANTLSQEKPRDSEWSNLGDICNIIRRIISDPTKQPLIDVKFCNIALRFYYKHTMIGRARGLIVLMRRMELPLVTVTANIILQSAAAQKDLHNFAFLLRLLLRAGFQPDDETWVQFMMAVESAGVRAYILHKMKEKGMLKRISTARDVAALMIQHDLKCHLEGGHKLDRFLAHMDDRYGVGWMSTAAGNGILAQGAFLESVSRVTCLLEEMKERGFVADTLSMNILLHKFLPSRRIHQSFAILGLLYHLFGRHPEKSSYEILFLQAWRNRLLNVARVVWRIAHFDGLTTYKMRKLVTQSLRWSSLRRTPRTRCVSRNMHHLASESHSQSLLPTRNASV